MAMATTSRLVTVPAQYWSLPLEQLLDDLQTTPQGLTSQQVSQRLQEFGINQIQAHHKATALGVFLNQFKSPIVIILLFATGVSAFLQDWTDALIIFLIVLSSAVLSFIQEYNAGNAVEKLRSQVTIKTHIVRDEKDISIPSEQVVPGDIVKLNAGSLIPADGVLMEAKDFFVSQAVLTGETFPVEKQPGQAAPGATLSERTNVVFMGTSVRSGSATAVITETGARTSFGQIAGKLNLHPPETEFERGIRRLGYLLSEVMFILVIAIFAFNVLFQKPVIDSLLFSIALAVGLTPQLLPAIININLAKGSQAMAQRGVIVRRLASIENFGSMDILCTDKTGTLTEGVVRLDAALDPGGKASEQVLKYAFWNASLQTGMSNPLDEAILANNTISMDGVQKIDEIPYDFSRKRLGIVVCSENQNLLVVKGALETILSVCAPVASLGSDHQPLDRADVEKRYAAWSAQGYRVLGVAVKPVPQKNAYSIQDEQEMEFAGFLLFFDPPKTGVKETIDSLAQLGVALKVITGDNKLVAAHVAQAVGLQNAKILTGSEINALNDPALWHMVQQASIFAEVDPNQKERLILALKKTGHVVGYMGDGINDAPALHAADVGISVDNAVDVAKEAADFVLLKQDLGVLRQGILQGRRTFANTLKYVFMATSANFGNMFSMAGASIFLPFLPMLPKQILLINFLTDFPEMAIAGDNVDEEFIQSPHRWNVHFIRNFMLVFGPISSIFDFLTFGVLLFVLRAGEASFHTGWFIESVISAGLVVFALRTRLPFRQSHPSRLMMLATGLVALGTLLLPYSPLAGLLNFQPLPVDFLLAVAVIVTAYFITAELAKRWFFKRVQM
jgi:Mg2+-importing ATPase